MKKALAHRFNLIFLTATVCLLSVSSYSQKKTKEFTGMLEYRISPRDTSLQGLVDDNSMVIYTNDTITRMENFTGSLGKQTTIRHMGLNKSYLMIDVSDTMRFAIQTDLNLTDSLKKLTKYTFEKKLFKRKILGMKAKRMMVNHPDFEEPIEFLYLKKYSREYINNFEFIPGLLVKYSVVTPDGVLDYELVKFSQYTPDRDLFGVPSNYKRVSFDEFMDQMLEIRNLTPE